MDVRRLSAEKRCRVYERPETRAGSADALDGEQSLQKVVSEKSLAENC